MVTLQQLVSLSRASNNLDSINSFHPVSREEYSEGHPLDPMEIEEQGTLIFV
jgi:hypothetical protein